MRDTSDVLLCHSMVVGRIFYFLMFRISDAVQSSSRSVAGVGLDNSAQHVDRVLRVPPNVFGDFQAQQALLLA